MARKRQASTIDMLGGVKKSLCSQMEHDEDLEMENDDIVTVSEGCPVRKELVSTS